MKKTFTLTSEKVPTARLVEAIKHDVRKYLKRERAKALPKTFNYWDFDCRFGADQASSEVIAVSEIDQHINQAEQTQMAAFYLEILAKPAFKEKSVPPKKAAPQHNDDEDDYLDEDYFDDEN